MILEELEYLFSRGCIGDEKWMKVFDLAELGGLCQGYGRSFLQTYGGFDAYVKRAGTERCLWIPIIS